MVFKVTGINNNSPEIRNSRYVQGGLTDIYNNRLGWWEIRKFEQHEDDSIVTILDREAARADLISFRLYGKSSYAWLVLQYNNIVDPVTELIAGKIIRMPTQQRLILDIITKPEGGKTVK